jgi:hypothetical protein
VNLHQLFVSFFRFDGDLQEVSVSFLEYSTDYNVSDYDASNNAVCRKSPSIRLYDGNSQAAPNIASFCNNYRPSPAGDFRSTGNQFFVTMELPCSYETRKPERTISFQMAFRAVNTLAELAAGKFLLRFMSQLT